MSLDQPASGQALWALYDAAGIRPEWVLPVLGFESGLDPSVPNRAGAPYYGLGQNSEADILAGGATSVSDYLAWPASRQLEAVVCPYFQRAQASYGPIRSGIQVYQAELAPASLQYARGLDDVIYARGGSRFGGQEASFYASNSVFDKAGKGFISPRDLGAAVAGQVAKAAIQKAIADAYALRPAESATDAVYGSGAPTTTKVPAGPWRSSPKANVGAEVAVALVALVLAAAALSAGHLSPSRV